MLKSKEILTMVLVVAFIGCASSNSNSIQEDTVQKTTFLPTQNEVLATQQNEGTIMMEARLAGVLERDKDGCIRVNGDLIIWPYGSTIKDDLIYDKDANLIAEIGESVVFGGGGMGSDENSAEDIKRVSEQLPNAQCADPYFFVHSVN